MELYVLISVIYLKGKYDLVEHALRPMAISECQAKQAAAQNAKLQRGEKLVINYCVPIKRQ